MASSANYNKNTLVLSLATMKPSINLVSSTLIIILLRTSATVKGKRERGSPYLKPLIALTQSFAFPLTRIAKLVEDKHPLIQNLYFGLNPFLLRHQSNESSICTLIYYLISVELQKHPHKVLFDRIPTLLIHCNNESIQAKGLFLIQFKNYKAYLLFREGPVQLSHTLSRNRDPI